MLGDKLKDLITLSRQVQWQYQLEKYTDESLKMILPSILKAQRELDGFLSKPLGGPVTRGRQEALLEEIDDLLLGVQSQLGTSIQEVSAVAGQAAAREYSNIVSFDGKVPNFNMVSLSPEQLRSMVNQPVGGVLLNDWISRTFDSAIQKEIGEEMLTGFLKGESVYHLQRRLRETFDIVKRDAETLTRTWVANANNAAIKEVYDRNADIMEGEEWCAHLEVNLKSGRGTCLRCAGLDGRVYPLNEAHIRPPLHPRCRCFMVPKTKSYKELGLDIDDLKEWARPYQVKKGTVVQQVGQFDGKFSDWLMQQPKKYQVDMLGPNRYRLIQEGVVKFDDLVDDVGNIRLLKKVEKSTRV